MKVLNRINFARILTCFPFFQVLVPSAGIRGFLDASEYGTWLKHFQSSQDESKHNVKHLLLAGQVSSQMLFITFSKYNHSRFAEKIKKMK